jgi:undecaprenyl-diphosphatase
MTTSLLDWIGGLSGPVLLLATFLLAFGESAALVDLVVPGEAGMVVAGAAAHSGGVPLPAAIAAAALGAALGDAAGYAVGRRWGGRLVRRWKFTRRHLEPQMARAEELFRRRGGITVLGSRWVGALRAVVPLIAGTSRMPYGTFTAWNVIGGLSWSAAVVSLGYFFGRPAAHFIDRFALAVSIGAVVLVVAWIAWRALRRRRAATG